MNYNPYAAPQAAPPQAPGGPTVGQPQPWEIGEVLSRAFEIYKANWGVLSGAFVVMMVVGAGPGYSINLGWTLSTGKNDPLSGVSLGTSFLNYAITAFFGVGMNRICLSAARGEAPQFATLFSGGARFLPYLGMLILMSFGIAIGCFFFLVPGVILALGLALGPLFIADTDLGVIDTMRASWEAMKGQKAPYFLFVLVAMAIGVAGVLACCLGLFVAAPIIYVAQAIIFLRITGRGAAALPAPGGYGGPPPGYGGPPPGYGGAPPGYGGPPGGAPPGGGGYGGPPPGAPPGGYGPPGGGGGYGPPGGGGGYGPQGGGGGYGPGGGGFPPR
jgi:hypothetical protein